MDRRDPSMPDDDSSGELSKDGWGCGDYGVEVHPPHNGLGRGWSSGCGESDLSNFRDAGDDPGTGAQTGWGFGPAIAETSGQGRLDCTGGGNWMEFYRR